MQLQICILFRTLLFLFYSTILIFQDTLSIYKKNMYFGSKLYKTRVHDVFFNETSYKTIFPLAMNFKPYN